MKSDFKYQSEWPPKHSVSIGGGVFSQGAPSWDFGIWRQSGLDGGGRASVQVWRCHSGECLVGVAAMANLDVDQARALAEALLAAADCASAESCDGAGDFG